MKNILSAVQIRDADQYSIQHEPITSIDLMERASHAFVAQFIQLVPVRSAKILVVCGTGNNAGDGLAIARLLQQRCYGNITVWVMRYADRESPDFAENFARLKTTPTPTVEIFDGDAIPEIQAAVIIDALFGSGLNRPLTGSWRAIAKHINDANKHVIAVDIPSGLPSEGRINPENGVVYADDAITFQRPKTSFFFPESERAYAQYHVVDIGLDEAYIQSLTVDFRLVEAQDICKIHRRRTAFSHKGTYGHALIVAGQAATMGAALLSCGACLYSGSGLTTAYIPQSGLAALNTAFPEVMYSTWGDIRDDWNKYNAVGMGPGLGKSSELLAELLEYAPKSMILDADGLNYLAHHQHLLAQLPENTIITPHVKEFDRLFGLHENWWDRVQTAKHVAASHRIIILLKNRYTFIVTPSRDVFINPTGNPAMASGGMGDVLTGIVTSFLAQGYSPIDAAILGCYIHGATGDLLASRGMAVIPASEIIRKLPVVIGALT